MELICRPLENWPRDLTTARQARNPFRQNFEKTRRKLQYELGKLDAHTVVVQIAFPERGISPTTGWPRADRSPEHPGVIVCADTKHGSLKWVKALAHVDLTDAFDGLLYCSTAAHGCELDSLQPGAAVLPAILRAATPKRRQMSRREARSSGSVATARGGGGSKQRETSAQTSPPDSRLKTLPAT